MAELIEISKNPQAQAILKGFRLLSLTIKNSETGEKVWSSNNWADDVFTTVKEAHLPARLLSFKAVGREIVFSTKEAIKDFRIEQNVLIHGTHAEEWDYKFGFVMPESENSWETIVEAAGEGKMLPAEYLSGNMFIVTSFYSGDLFISRSVVQVFYE
ncbi:Retinal rod rhodopsin-sensitive cGMP 3',5'-cyclic phosphodiesterase subunit delta [Histomonas meleagridis]|uniref:Retinal rod rhodopsin-sensitive cGMP 3',5'-cyclic phosphodiesterase subunit delta n=1 Tax=Histomonas meleagridis TaxID=135588 RepID=UPI003559AD0F|nr:Retinal rod rhodopsin-sensitive cGMP 3',5'-cyclic phosphodiesterase subunit delta [Histomonas meleagridis]KAH0805170.1 Retinal rod rhodopsin-sensitive cGMP 3',5'-cyclic phosphodiesterase subunit delta [Histomonas meleagridis]